ncbi:MAG: penicillin-binding protein 2 [Alphaproteobacteria bacterium]|nr:penicillin-binding protein 2 [Alphaproteobacteria bacterium]
MTTQKKKIYFVGMHESALEMARGRLVFLGGLFVICFIVVLARSIDLAVIQGNSYQIQKDYMQISQKSDVLRGDIVDRNGVLIGRSLSFLSLYADPKLVREPRELTRDIKNIFPALLEEEALKKLQSNKRFVWVKRNITPQQQEEVLKLGHPAIGFKKDTRRTYPHGNLLSHIVGASGSDGQGLSGIESSFDDFLAQGKDLELTIDARIQHALKREIAGAIDKYEAVGGAGIVMNVQNGELLALTSLPDYDLHSYAEAEKSEIFNKTSLGVYELGSIFKIFTTAKYLEDRNNALSDSFDTREPIKVGRFQIKDYHPEDRVLSVPEIFIHSSNIGTALMAQKIGSEKFKDFYDDLGLLQKPDFDLPEVGSPLIPDPWREVSTLTASYGHGIAVSPLQLVRAVASVVNGGKLVMPTLVKQMVEGKSALDERVVSKETAHRVRQMMRLTVTQGTGSKAEVEGFLVGGKTGTAEKPGKGGYQDQKLISSFLGVFPMNKPEYAVFIMLDEPKGTKETYGYATGGWVAAPAVSKVITSMISIMGLKPSKDTHRFDQEVEALLPQDSLKDKQQIAQGIL